MGVENPAYNPLRLAVEVLASGPGPIRSRVLAAAPHFGVAFEVIQRNEAANVAERHLALRIGAALVEGGPEGDEHDNDDTDANVAESVGVLDDARLVEIAVDIVRLHELVAGLRLEENAAFYLD